MSDGHEVVVVDDFSTGSHTNLVDAVSKVGERLTVEAVDLRESRCTEVIASADAEVIFHLGAQADVRSSVADPHGDADINILGTIRVLEGARRSRVRKIVFAASGGTLYGETDPSLLPLAESIPHNPASPYGASKFAAGVYLRVYGSLYGLHWTELALANVYGPRQNWGGETGVVSIFATQLLAGQTCTIFGSGEQTRDFVFVDDVADAFVAASMRGNGYLINIGTGVETSINDLYRMIRNAGFRRVSVNVVAREEKEPCFETLLASAEKA